MFHRTLRDNIAFARPHATDEEIYQAAQAAHVTDSPATCRTDSARWSASVA